MNRDPIIVSWPSNFHGLDSGRREYAALRPDKAGTQLAGKPLYYVVEATFSMLVFRRHPNAIHARLIRRKGIDSWWAPINRPDLPDQLWARHKKP